MTTSSVTGATPSAATTAASQSAADTSRKTLAGNFDTFLTLLTTQLKNQDPMQPMDANQFTQQLVQFSGVEQSIQTNKNLESILGVSRSGQAAGAVSYIGRSVTATSDKAALQNGGAAWNYELASPAAETSLLVTDANKKVVAVLPGETTQGAHSVQWNGKDSSGAALPDGVYTLQVVAKDATEQTVQVKQTVTGTVQGIDTSDSDTGPLLSLNGVPVDLGSVISVQQAAQN